MLLSHASMLSMEVMIGSCVGMSNGEIIVEQLYKRYGDFTAVDGVSFEVRSGEIFGFLGPNGAGKSTTVKILTTLALPSDGRALVGGYDIGTQAEHVRQISGVALQEIGLDALMKPLELLSIQGQIFGMSRKQAIQRGEELLRLVKLDEFKDRLVGKYSGGMRRRLDLALALVHEPDILFLDEPTTGLDPYSRKCVWEVIRQLNKEMKMTIFLTTHYMEEAACSDYIVILSEGAIKAAGTPEQLKTKYCCDRLILTLKEIKTNISVIEKMGYNYQLDRERIDVYIDHSLNALDIIEKLKDDIESFEVIKGNMDDVFLNVTSGNYIKRGSRYE